MYRGFIRVDQEDLRVWNPYFDRSGAGRDYIETLLQVDACLQLYIYGKKQLGVSMSYAEKAG